MFSSTPHDDWCEFSLATMVTADRDYWQAKCGELEGKITQLQDELKQKEAVMNGMKKMMEGFGISFGVTFEEPK